MSQVEDEERSLEQESRVIADGARGFVGGLLGFAALAARVLFTGKPVSGFDMNTSRWTIRVLLLAWFLHEWASDGPLAALAPVVYAVCALVLLTFTRLLFGKNGSSEGEIEE